MARTVITATVLAKFPSTKNPPNNFNARLGHYQIVENIDLCPTFTELGSATTPANVDGVSLVSLLHGQSVKEWRSAALVEHHGPVREPIDPDMPSVRSGNPTTYEAIRSRTSLYVEYADGEKEYHDLATDPDELRNTFSSLSNEEKSGLHKMLDAAANCHDAKYCWAAQGGGQERAAEVKRALICVAPILVL